MLSGDWSENDLKSWNITMIQMRLFHEDADLYDKVQIIITAILRLTLLIAMIGGALNARYTVVFISLLTLMVTFIPDLLEKRYRIELPEEFEFVIVLFLYASLFLGEVHGYYTRFWWWDTLLHAGSGLAMGFVGFLMVHILYQRNQIRGHSFFIALFAFCFAMAIGSVWEIFEFGMDQVFGLDMQKSGLIDTMWDLIVDAIGALVASAIGFFYIKGNVNSFTGRLVKKFMDENPRLYQK